ncbi:serine acetyltransferase [Microbacterium sp. G2-8]|uniref:serine acetyltransferase n=1 Tax=Microbacterium sp. G2-8 TaxID=2842454 RepID=UPI001C8909D9|nr:serine acetyltransferase [Microbacterium sp. G2-8]
MSAPRDRMRAACAADRAANAAYPKSRLVLAWFRRCQRWRETPGRLGRALFLVYAVPYRLVTEGFLGIELPTSTSVGPGLRLRHGIGIVVNPHTVIGSGVMLRHGVTLGNRRERDDCPVIEADVEIGVGAVIIGAITVGRGARIGPNAVVVRDVPPGATVLSPGADILSPGRRRASRQMGISA